MNKSLLFLIVGSLSFFASNYSSAELGLFSNSAEKEETIEARLSDGDFEFSDEEVRCSTGVLAIAYKKLKSKDLAKLVALHSQWKAVDSILIDSRLIENIPNLGSGRMVKTILVAEKINKEATVVLLRRQLHSAVKNGEITFLSFAFKWMNSNKIDISLDEKEWQRLMKSIPFNRDVVSGPSLKVHILIREYWNFASKHKVKPQLDPVTLKVIEDWKDDPFETKKIINNR